MKNIIYIDGAGQDIIKVDGVCYKRTGQTGQATVDAAKAQPVLDVSKDCKKPQ